MEIAKKAVFLAVPLCFILLVVIVQVIPVDAFPLKCIFHEATGLYCAGCGGTRAVYALFRGDILTALHSNALVTLLLPVAFYFYAAGFIKTFFKKILLPLPRNFVPFLWALLIITCVFMIIRNIGVFPFTFLKP